MSGGDKGGESRSGDRSGFFCWGGVVCDGFWSDVRWIWGHARGEFLLLKGSLCAGDEVKMKLWEKVYSPSIQVALLVLALSAAPFMQGCKADEAERTPQADVGEDYKDVRDGEEDVEEPEDVEDSADDEDVEGSEDVDEPSDIEEGEDVEEPGDVDDGDPRFDCDEEGAPFGGGDGSLGAPYLLCAPGHLEAVGVGQERLRRNYVLVRSIDMEGVADFEPIGSADTPFRGRFDGNERGISNLKIERGAQTHVGLFGAVGRGGEVMDLRLDAVELKGADVVGGVAGANLGGELRGVAVEGEVKGLDVVGGVVGSNDGGALQESYSLAVVEGRNTVGGLVGMNNEGEVRASYSAGEVEGERNIGGAVGLNFDGLVKDSYSVVVVSGDSQVGGFVGANAGRVTNIYSAGAVVGSDGVGGLVGMELDGVATSSYWDKDTSGQDLSAQGRGLRSAEFEDSLEFDGWDFSGVWEMGSAPDGQERPILRWQE